MKLRHPLLVVLVGVWVCLSHAENALAASGDVDIQERLTRTMDEEVRQGFWGVVYISRAGKQVLHQAYGLSNRRSSSAMRKDTVIDAGSFSKQVTATAALILAREGKLTLDDALAKYFKNVPADKASITVRQLLSHTGGLHEWIFADDFIPIPREVWLDKVFAAPLVHAPGKRYHYSNDGITLVAMIIENVTGEPYQRYLRQKFFEPLRMHHTGWYDDVLFDAPAISVATGYRNGKDDGAPNEWPGPYWALLGNGGILWNVDDMLKWHEAIHGTLLSQSERDQLFAAITEDPERSLYPSETAPMYYGLAWRVGRSACGDLRVGHTGTGISHNVAYRYYRDRDILIYVASNKLDVDYRGGETVYARRAAEALTRVMMEDCSR
jgi:CubicO group peptidase (beta-lactamase class C family)